MADIPTARNRFLRPLVISSLVVAFPLLPLAAFVLMGRPAHHAIARYVLAHLLLASSILGCSGIIGRLRRGAAPLFLAVASTLIFLANAIELGLLDFYGQGYSPAVFFNFNLEAVRIAVRQYPIALVLVVALVTAFCTILFKATAPLATWARASLRTSLVIAVVPAVAIAFAFNVLKADLPTWSFTSELARFFAPRAKLFRDKNDDRLLKQLGIDLSVGPLSEVRVVAPKSPSNLILIFLEGYDFQFTRMGGAKFEDLTPSLNALSKEMTVLENYYSPEGFTIAGLMAGLGGILPQVHSNTLMMENAGFYKNLPMLPDLLNKAGYYQVFMGGARKGFSGKERFLKTHKFDEVLGWEEWEKSPAYQGKHHIWGIYDQDLFREAAAKIEQLKGQKKPFNVTMLTLDTHVPGFPAPDNPKYGDNDGLNAINSTDHALGWFVKHLKDRHILDDTALVIVSDHHAPETDQHIKSFGRTTARRVVGMFKSPAYPTPPSIKTVSYTPDLAPTVLDLLGIKTNRTFSCGRSVFDESRPRAFLVGSHSDASDNYVIQTGEAVPGTHGSEPSRETSPPGMYIKRIVDLIDDVLSGSHIQERKRDLADVLSKTRIVSSGTNRGVAAGITIDGVDQMGMIDGGLNAAVADDYLDGLIFITIDSSGVVTSREHFDTVRSDLASGELVTFVRRIPLDDVVIAMVKGDGAARLSGAAKAALVEFGARHIDRLKAGGSYVLVARKRNAGAALIERLDAGGNALDVTLPMADIRSFLSRRKSAEPDRDLLAIVRRVLLENSALQYASGPGARAVLISVVSAGWNAGQAEIVVDGAPAFHMKRGFNVATVDPMTGKIVQRVHFDTHELPAASDAMAAFITALPDNEVIIATAFDEAAESMTPNLVKAMESLGATKIKHMGYRASYLLIAMKAGRNPIELLNKEGKKLKHRMTTRDLQTHFSLTATNAPRAFKWGPAFGAGGTAGRYLIAHAGGTIHDMTYTNSLEALDTNYKAGYRVFELDFDWTSDGKLVSIHDWVKTYYWLFGRAVVRPDYNEFVKLDMRDGLTQLTPERLKKWQKERPDAYIVTDIKEDNVKGLAEIGKVLDKARVIPQIYGFDEYRDVAAMGFDKIILTLYRSDDPNTDVVEFVKGKGLFAVTMPRKRVLESDLAAQLNRVGVLACAHAIDDIPIEILESKGVFCYYTHTMRPETKDGVE